MQFRSNPSAEQQFEGPIGVGQVVQCEISSGRTEFGGGESARADTDGASAGRVRCLDIERRIAEDDDVAVRWFAAHDACHFRDACADEIASDGVQVAETAAGKVMPEAEVLKLVFRAHTKVPRGEAHQGSLGGQGIEQLENAREDDAALRLDGRREVLEVGGNEALEVGFEGAVLTTMALKALDEDATVRAAVEEHSLGAMLDAELPQERCFHGGAASACRSDERHVDIEEQDAGHVVRAYRGKVLCG